MGWLSTVFKFASGAFSMYKVWILIGVGALLLGFVGGHLWGDHKREKRYDALLKEQVVVQLNYQTCMQTNADNDIEITKQNKAIDELEAKRDAALKAGAKAVAESVEKQQKAKEDNRVLRNKVKTMLAAEQCAVAPLPVDASSLLGDAIRKANGG